MHKVASTTSPYSEMNCSVASIAHVCISVGAFLRKKEDDIRIFIQELSQQPYNEDDVIAELQAMINDVTRTRQPIPQVVELQRLSFLNRDALERGAGPLSLQQDRNMHSRQEQRTKPQPPPRGDRGVAPNQQMYRDSQEQAERGVALQQDRLVYRNSLEQPVPHAQGERGVALQRDGMVYRDSQEQGGMGVALQQDGMMYRDRQEQRGVPLPFPHGERGAYHSQVKSLYNTADGYGGSSTLV